jgi:predicted GH43/DUF377 family glycosyl hydrolase
MGRMTMKWRKLGLIFVPDGGQWWAKSHAMAPTPFRLSENVIRLYISHLDDNRVGRVGFIDIAVDDPTRVIARSPDPVLDIGKPGAFDDNGVVPSCIVASHGELYLYYSGFQLQKKVPYTVFTGIASGLVDSRTYFSRRSPVPLMDRTDGQLYMRTTPFVLREGSIWRMWYSAGNGWVHSAAKSLPTYSVHHIQSDDGIRWTGTDVECLRPNGPDEIGLSRPFVLCDGGGYRMWYSSRIVDGYAIGYATSPDGLRWTRRDDEVGISRSETGWDSEMTCYPAVVRAKNHWMLFYNGNGYGRTGVGVAVAPISAADRESATGSHIDDASDT